MGVDGLDGEAEVCDFEFLLASDEDVGGFEVAVDDVLAGEVEVAREDLGHVLGRLFLGEPLLDVFAEV